MHCEKITEPVTPENNHFIVQVKEYSYSLFPRHIYDMIFVTNDFEFV